MNGARAAILAAVWLNQNKARINRNGYLSVLNITAGKSNIS
jgi:hypothetical protein